jgi:hypothetical protein
MYYVFYIIAIVVKIVSNILDLRLDLITVSLYTIKFSFILGFMAKLEVVNFL